MLNAIFLWTLKLKRNVYTWVKKDLISDTVVLYRGKILKRVNIVQVTTDPTIWQMDEIDLKSPGELLLFFMWSKIFYNDL